MLELIEVFIFMFLSKLTAKIGCVSNELPTYLREGRAISFSNLEFQVESCKNNARIPYNDTYRLV